MIQLRHLYLLLIVAGLYACTIAEPELPEFETEIAIPLGENVFTLIDLVGENDVLVGEDGDTILTFFYERDLDPFDFSNKLDFRFPPHSVSDTLGSFVLDPPDSQDYIFNLEDLYPPAAGWEGTWAVIPAFSFDRKGKTHTFARWEEITLASGTLEVEINNGLPVSLGRAGEEVEVILLEEITDAEILRVGFSEEIPPGGELTREVDLSGVVLPRSVYARLRGSSPGSAPDSVWIDPELSVLVRLSARDLRGKEGEAKIPAQSFEEDTRWALPESLHVEEAIISSGILDISLSNELPVGAEISVDLLDFAPPGGSPPLSHVFLVGPGATIDEPIDISGMLIASPEGGGIDSLSVRTRVVTLPSEDFVAVSSSDGASIEIDSTEVYFERITGSMGRREEAIDAGTRSIDFPSELEDFSLAQAEMVLDISYHLGFAVDVDIDVRAFKDGVERAILHIHEELVAALDGDSLTKRVVLDDTNSNLLEIIDAYPDEIRIAGLAAFGGEGISGKVQESDFITMHLSLSAPLRVAIAPTTLGSDPDSLEIDEEVRDFMRDQMQGANFRADVGNTFPFGSRALIRLARTASELETAPGVVLGPIVLEAAETDSLTGMPLKPFKGTIELSLSEEEMDFLREGDLFSDVSVEIPGTEGKVVTLRSSQALRTNSLLTLRVLVEQGE